MFTFVFSPQKLTSEKEKEKKKKEKKKKENTDFKKNFPIAGKFLIKRGFIRHFLNGQLNYIGNLLESATLKP